MTIKRYTSAQLKELKDETNWERLRNMSDDDIDFSDIPMLTDDLLPSMKVYEKGELLKELERKSKPTKVSLNSDVVSYFKSLGDDWQAKINEVLTQAIKMKDILT